MRFVILFLQLFLIPDQSFAELDDETLVQAAAHQKAMIYGTVANRLADDIEAAQLTEVETNELLDAVVEKLVSCELDALEHLGERVRYETIQALASGASKQELAQVMSKHLDWESNWQANLAVYSDAKKQCTVLINQEFGIIY